MLLAYYQTDDGTKGWIKAKTPSDIEKYLNEHNITEYGLTVDEHEYEKTTNSLTILECQKSALKEFVDRL